ncbi:MAG: NUDIX domain-containing protein [Flavobacteriia bacterium]|nr:NUDIX domain-containing protein [Flavobacteriia bacterium]
MNVQPLVELVDSKGQPIGSAPKMDVHLDGRLHRAISVFVFDDSGNELLQKRASHKYHAPGLWSNAVCSHPRPGESPWAAAQEALATLTGSHGQCSLREADVIVALDWVDPAGTIQQAFPPGSGKGAKVINVSNDYRIHNGWSMDYEMLPAVDVWLAEPKTRQIHTLLLRPLDEALVTQLDEHFASEARVPGEERVQDPEAADRAGVKRFSFI